MGDSQEVNEIINFAKDNLHVFESEQPFYGHQDIKPQNFMWNNGDVLTIDYDGTTHSYFAYAMRGNILVTNKDHKRKKFYKGVVHGFYGDKIPLNYHNQFICTRIIERIWCIIRAFQNKDFDKAHKKWNEFVNTHLPLNTLKARYKFDEWL